MGLLRILKPTTSKVSKQNKTIGVFFSHRVSKSTHTSYFPAMMVLKQPVPKTARNGLERVSGCDRKRNRQLMKAALPS